MGGLGGVASAVTTSTPCTQYRMSTRRLLDAVDERLLHTSENAMHTTVQRPRPPGPPPPHTSTSVHAMHTLDQPPCLLTPCLLEAVDELLQVGVPVEVVGLVEGVDLPLLRHPDKACKGGVFFGGGDGGGLDDIVQLLFLGGGGGGVIMQLPSLGVGGVFVVWRVELICG